jgi:hypothetical protein
MPAPILSKTASDLVAVVKTENAKIAETGSVGIKSALAIGRIGLDVDNKGVLPHGEKRAFYRACNIPSRRFQKYKQLARLAANAPSTALLAATSIEEAIRLLSPPRPVRAKAGGPSQGGAGKPDEKLSAVLRQMVDRSNAPGADHEALAAARQVAALLMAKGFGSDTDIAISITPRADMARKARARAA